MKQFMNLSLTMRTERQSHKLRVESGVVQAYKERIREDEAGTKR